MFLLFSYKWLVGSRVVIKSRLLLFHIHMCFSPLPDSNRRILQTYFCCTPSRSMMSDCLLFSHAELDECVLVVSAWSTHYKVPPLPFQILVLAAVDLHHCWGLQNGNFFISFISHEFISHGCLIKRISSLVTDLVTSKFSSYKKGKINAWFGLYQFSE